ncbi:MAG: AEC family transporter [Rhizobiales bacterium]|nr:AEC family transporter [Hyphomicrobiales bacterium]OJU32366.1 MAG: transporter [Rhizobiales bacterium 68-8]
MLAVFESVLPIFLIIVLGSLLRRTPLMDAAGWLGLEKASYWLLYPALLVSTLMHADFSGLRLDAILVALLAGVGLLAALVLATWPLWRRAGTFTPAEFSSVFQTAVRWNSFVALAVAQSAFPPAAVTIVALVMAVIVVPINIASVAVVARFGNGRADWPDVLRKMAANPLILAVVAGLLLRLVPGGIYGPADSAMRLVGQAAIGMGLISIGAGLRPGDVLRPRLAIWWPVGLKIVVMPALIGGLAWALGVRGPDLVYLVLCGSVPTAMNGYMLARQLGGDAEFYAAVTTLQTALAVVTMPAALAWAAQLASG